MSKSVEEIAAEIVIAVIAKLPATGNAQRDTDNAVEAFTKVHQAVLKAYHGE
ncbi:hypothetical protein [Stenotrophomonas acidaminiphila]|uniref:hypothetical protein n=1 Tax=Stenotrophomonas acidaminiphila TaxID=128780 RepID=UPI0028ABCD30|nr:hypothetical protein [Stenotrophomonas acidaminiphila]